MFDKSQVVDQRVSQGGSETENWPRQTIHVTSDERGFQLFSVLLSRPGTIYQDRFKTANFPGTDAHQACRAGPFSFLLSLGLSPLPTKGCMVLLFLALRKTSAPLFKHEHSHLFHCKSIHMCSVFFTFHVLIHSCGSLFQVIVDSLCLHIAHNGGHLQFLVVAVPFHQQHATLNYLPVI